jgi:LDH2 family malate/lactate/ureidoglycolate dehydrogenase
MGGNEIRHGANPYGFVIPDPERSEGVRNP